VSIAAAATQPTAFLAAMHTSNSVLALAALLLKPTAAPAASLALVLAVDVSTSVSADSYLLQRHGIARAFENPRLVGAISVLPGGIEALVLEWSDPDRIAVTVGWRRITDIDSAAGFAAAVRATARSSTGLTAIGPALLAAAAEFDRVPEPAERRVIDISGDGVGQFRSPPGGAPRRVGAPRISIKTPPPPRRQPRLQRNYPPHPICPSRA